MSLTSFEIRSHFMTKEIRVGVLAGHNIAHRGENCEKMGSRVKRVEGCESLKKTENQTSDNQTMPRTRPGVPDGTVADQYYYMNMYNQ